VPQVPQGLSDLYLAPVAIGLDAQIEEFARLSADELKMRVSVGSDSLSRTRSEREVGLLEALRQGVDCHGWVLAWDPRGLRISNDDHSLVLGVPPSFRDLLDGEA